MYELFARSAKYIFIVLIYYFLFNFLKIMIADLRTDKSLPQDTGFCLLEEDGIKHTLYTINTIGRAEDSDIIINDPFISSKHALITKRGRNLIIQDLHSTNGSFINDKRVKRPTKLKENDEIRLGTKKFTF